MTPCKVKCASFKMGQTVMLASYAQQRRSEFSQYSATLRSEIGNSASQHGASAAGTAFLEEAGGARRRVSYFGFRARRHWQQRGHSAQLAITESV